jgi:ribosomal protein S18 acetylase RimI-like enzyme
LRFKKSKSFCTLIPERNRLVVQIVFGGEGPLARRKLAYLERTLVRPEYRRRGLGTRLLCEAMRAGREAGCLYLRCSNDWDNEAERRLFLKCGFALVDLNGESDQEPCYFAVRPLQGREEL